MFSLDRFSLSQFSLGTVEGNVIQVEGSFFEEMQSVSGVAVPVYATVFMVDLLRGASKGTIAIKSGFQSEAGMQAEVEGNANIVLTPTMSASMFGVSNGIRNEKISGLLAEDLTANTWGSKRMPFSVFFSDAFGSGAFASKDILTNLFLSEVLTSLSGAGIQSTDQATFTISIPAGGELRIDSEIFRVLLDGENALYTQSGDWIHLSRPVLYLEVESASGDLEGTITYQERYL